MRCVFWWVMALALSAVAHADAVSLRALPGKVYIETSASQQFLNFDLEITNPLPTELRLSSVELRLLDDEGRVVHRDFMDGSSRRSAELTPERKIPANGKLVLFNPFPAFGASVPLRHLRYRLTLVDESRRNHVAEMDVAPVHYVQKTRLIVPLRGRVLIWDGHDHASHHRRTDFSGMGLGSLFHTNFQRYAFDFVLVDEQGELTRAPQSSNDDLYAHDPAHNDRFHGFGAEVLAAAGGTVVDIHDGEEDDKSFDPAELSTRETAMGGNYIIIDHGNGEFSWFGHLRKGSLRVKVGQKVRQGEVIAAVGCSGSSLFPHLHYELRTGPGAARAEGLPAYFTGFTRASDGKRATKPMAADTGDILLVP